MKLSEPIGKADFDHAESPIVCLVGRVVAKGVARLQTPHYGGERRSHRPRALGAYDLATCLFRNVLDPSLGPTNRPCPRRHRRPDRCLTATPGGVDGEAHSQEKPQGHRDAEEYV